MAQRLPWSRPQLPSSFTGAGGTAGPGDIMAASFDQMLHVDNTTAANDSLVDAYEALRRDVKAATGTDLGNPMIDPTATSSPLPNPLGPLGRIYGTNDVIAEQRLLFQQQVNDLAARYPAEAVRDWAQRDPVRDAEAIARAADGKLADVMASRPGWDSYVYAFAGAAGAAMRDPVTIGSLFLGGGPGGARTALGRIFATAGTEAAVNAGVEAAMQPWVQGWREQAGLDSGFDLAIANVAFAAAFGGALGAGGRGVVEAVDFARMTPEQRAAVPPAVRGAIDAGDTLAVIDAQRPPEIQPRRHEDMLTQAELVAHRQPIGPVLEADGVQINRIVEQLAPAPASVSRTNYVPRVSDDFAATLDTIRTGDPAGAASSARPVLRYLANIGGVDPNSPIGAEMRAVGITSQSMPGVFRAGGRQNIDNIPVVEATEAFPGRADLDDGNGYVRDQAWLDAMQLEVERKGAGFDGVQDERGYWERNGVDFERMDDAEILDRMADIADAEERYRIATDAAGDVDEAILLPPGLTRRAYTEQAVREAVRLAGPGVTDDVIRKAVDLHLVERETLADAVDWAMSDKAGVSRQLPEPALEGIGSSPPVPRGDPVDPPDLDDDWGADLEAFVSEQSAVTFTTAKGSTYVLHEDGTTTRDKAFRPEHGAAEQGTMPRSQATFFVTAEHAEELALFQAQGGPGKMAVVLTPDGHAGVKYVSGDGAGKFERRTYAKVQAKPAVGLTPVEIWNDGAKVHFGNKIVGVVEPEPMLVPFGDQLLTPAALKAELDKSAALERVVAACKLY